MQQILSQFVDLFTTPAYINSLWHGFVLTLEISFFAIIISLILGMIIALTEAAKPSPLLVVPKAICKVYTTIIRGTPMALQLFVMFFIIFAIFTDILWVQPVGESSRNTLSAKDLKSLSLKTIILSLLFRFFLILPHIGTSFNRVNVDFYCTRGLIVVEYNQENIGEDSI